MLSSISTSDLLAKVGETPGVSRSGIFAQSLLNVPSALNVLLYMLAWWLPITIRKDLPSAGFHVSVDSPLNIQPGESQVQSQNLDVSSQVPFHGVPSLWRTAVRFVRVLISQTFLFY